jgi:predicted nucleic acid-binding protein
MDQPEQGWPADASSLIYLAKADAFSEAGRCLRTILVPPAVWEESVEAGTRIGAPEVSTIRTAADRGILRRLELSVEHETLASTIASGYRLGSGESEVLAIGTEIGSAIVDEGRATKAAAQLGITVVSTLFLPVVGNQRSRLTEEEAIALLRRLAAATGARADAVYAIEVHLKGAQQ